MASADWSRRRFLAGLGALTAASMLPSDARAEGASFTLSNARILTGDGKALDGGLRVEGGRIVAMGPSVTGGQDLAGQTLWPGIWLAAAPIGLFEVGLEHGTHDESEGSDAVVPQVCAIDGYNPRSAVVGVGRSFGIQGALVVPTGGLVSGQAAWVRLVGDTREDVLLKAPAGLVIHIGGSGRGGGPGQPRSRMGVLARLRDLFDANAPPKDAPAEEGGKKAHKKGKDEAPAKEPEKKTAAEKALLALLKRETKALLAAERADDLLAALDLARAYNLDAVIVGAAEGHLVARHLADAKVPVLMGPVTTQPSSFDTLAASYENAARLHAAGVRIAIRTGDPHMARDLTTEAGIAVSYGLPHEAAIAAISGNAPSFWGLPQGVLREGAEASFVLSSGDPLQPSSRARRMWTAGAEVPLTSRQTELYERFK